MRDTLWSEFYDTRDFPAVIRLLAGYLKNIKTNSYKNAPLSKCKNPCPVLVYNHGVISIAAENILLMEHLASYGYIVVGVRHVEQNAEYAAIQKSVSETEKNNDQILFKKLSGTLDREERSQLSLQIYQQSTGMPVIVRRRAEDTSCVLDHLDTILQQVPGYSSHPITKVGALGLSLGGAVATDFCKKDSRCRAVANMDGGIYGDNILDPVTVPYLMLYSESNFGGNDFLKKNSAAEFQEQVISQANHANFHDVSLVLPVLRWFGVLGKVAGSEINERKNSYIKTFFDKNLR